ncbi:MAG: nicotinate-nucleotide adenylyltransferase [Limnoraphis sp. WC205]|jgi:nicotinate-nucleotide adenylyltransferase|nr:nicotinate-nucleotide adenylyltransferase [Limnoraphis sp. WC205]
MQIALFGTSADPPTSGHQNILRWLSQQFDQVVVWASDNPFKSHQTPIEHRTTMLKILIEDISPHDNIALHQELSSRRTLETVQGVKQYWPEAELHLVVGSDLIGQMPNWYKIEGLLSQVNLLVVPRPGYQVEEEKIKALQQLGGNVAIASITGLPVSSSNYRKKGDPETLTPAIQAYIEHHHLYQSPQ